MSEKEKHIEKYPIHNPDDESQGMELIDKEEGKKESDVKTWRVQIFFYLKTG